MAPFPLILTVMLLAAFSLALVALFARGIAWCVDCLFRSWSAVVW